MLTGRGVVDFSQPEEIVFVIDLLERCAPEVQLIGLLGKSCPTGKLNKRPLLDEEGIMVLAW